MSDSPPPLDDVEIKGDEDLKGQEEQEDQNPISQPESPKEEEPLFAEMEKPGEPEPEPELSSFEPPTLEATAAEEPPAKPVVKDTPSLVEAATSKPLDLFGDEEPEKKPVCYCINNR